jgi:hypothetical protein
MRRIAGLTIVVVLLVSGLAAATASAASKLTLSEEGAALTAGQWVELYGFENVTIDSSVTFIECPGTLAGLLLEVASNAQSHDELSVREGLGLFGGRTHCGSDGGGFGNVEVVFNGHGPLTLTAKGKATVPVGIFLQFEKELHECHYGKKLKGTSTVSSTPAPLQVAFPRQRLRLQKGAINSPGCPRTIEITVSLPTADGEEAAVEAQT